MLPHDKFDVIYFSHPNGKLLNDQHTDIVIPDFTLKNFVSVDVVIVQWQCIDFVVLFSYDYISQFHLALIIVIVFCTLIESNV